MHPGATQGIVYGLFHKVGRLNLRTVHGQVADIGDPLGVAVAQAVALVVLVPRGQHQHVGLSG